MASNDRTALTREEGLFVSGLHAAAIDEPMPRAVWGLYLLLAIVATAIAWSSIAHVDEIDGITAGGMPSRVKCLHVLVGHALAAGPGVNPFGDEALGLLPDWGAAGPCARAES